MFRFRKKHRITRPTLTRFSRHTPASFRPELQELEGRLVPTVSFHGGGVIPHVEVDPLYYGQAWVDPQTQAAPAAAANLVTKLDNFLKTISGSSYLAMLGEYGVGLGKFGRHALDNGPAAPASGTVTEVQIQAELKAQINAGALPKPNGSQVYFVYLPPGLSSQFDVDQFAAGHHNAFQMTVLEGWAWAPGGQGHPVPIYQTVTVTYAVVPYGGPVASLNLTDFQELTAVSSHELAESVTDSTNSFDPMRHMDGSYSFLFANGWWDNATGKEIGDLEAWKLGTLDGYTVQKEWSNFWNGALLPANDLGGMGSVPYYALPVNFPGVFGAQNGNTLHMWNGLFQWQIGPSDFSGWFVPLVG
jgi:hypothetical protein